MPAGRPSKYQPEFAEKARRLVAIGATDVDIAAIFDVSVRTIERWKSEIDEFWQAFEIGAGRATQLVERSLFQRAIGYKHEAQKIFQYEGEPVIVDYVEHYPPETAAASLWLRNRAPERWRDTVKVEQQITLVGLLDRWNELKDAQPAVIEHQPDETPVTEPGEAASEPAAAGRGNL